MNRRSFLIGAAALMVSLTQAPTPRELRVLSWRTVKVETDYGAPVGDWASAEELAGKWKAKPFGLRMTGIVELS